MDPDKLESLIGRLGTRGSTSLEDTVQSLVEAGPSVFPTLLRVLEDREYRQTLWERHGKTHEGEPIHEVYFPEHTLNVLRYDQMLRGNVIYVFTRRCESKAEPLASLLRAAADVAFKETYPGGRPDQSASDSEQGRWEAYLDACGSLDLDSIRTFWRGRPKDKHDADAGLASALSAGSLGISPRHAEVLEFLLRRGGDIDVELHPNIGHVALQYAAQDDDSERVQCLLAHGANVNHADYDGCTAFMFALRGDGRVGSRDPKARQVVLRTLLEAGADPAFQQREQYEDFEFVGPTCWEFADAEGEMLLAELGFSRPPDDGVDTAG